MSDEQRYLEQLAGANSLMLRICQRAGSEKMCRFFYCDVPDMKRSFPTPSDYLRALYVDGMIMVGCRHFIMACLALGMPDDAPINRDKHGPVEPDAPLVLRDDPDKIRNWHDWMNTALPGAVVAYICDKDPDLFDFWQRACIIFKGHWVIVYRGSTISMGPNGIDIRSIDYWKQYIVDERIRALDDGIDYTGPRRTSEFLRHVRDELRPESLTVFYYVI